MKERKERNSMHRIRVFLASSITEFSYERVQLGDFVRALNDILVERGVYIQLEKSEDITNAIDLYRKQNQYNRIIKESEYFFLLIGKAVGAYTMEEYETACGSEKEGMRIIFRQAPAEEETGMTAQASSKPGQLLDAGAAMTPESFRALLEEEKRAYMDCESTDSVKLALLMMLTGDEEIARGLLFRDGQAWLDGRAALSLMETPVYQKDDNLRQMILHKQDLEREYIACLREQTEEGAQRAETLREEIGQIAAQLAQQENSLLNLFTYINQQKMTGDRERRARKYLAQGDLPAAAEILRDPLREAEKKAAVNQFRRMQEAALKQIVENWKEAMSLMGGDFPEELPEEPAESDYLVDMLLKENSQLSQEFLVGLQAMGDYAQWLNLKMRWSQAAGLSRKLEAYMEVYGDREENRKALKDLQNHSGEKKA